MATNEAQRQRWNDEEWVAVWPKRERMTDAITPALLEALALQAGERVLDVGCGGGKATIAAARSVSPGGIAIGADISAGLTALAAQRAADSGVDNVTFCVADMQQDDVAGRPFDVVMSQFGVMFFDESVTAFANIRAHLAPGGRMAFACWQTADQNPWFLGPALAGIAVPPPPPALGQSPIGPFALGDPAYTQAILESAGFSDVGRTARNLVAEVPHDALVDASQLRFMGVPPDMMDAATAAVNDHLARFQTSPGMAKFPLAFQIFQATAQ